MDISKGQGSIWHRRIQSHFDWRAGFCGKHWSAALPPCYAIPHHVGFATAFDGAKSMYGFTNMLRSYVVNYFLLWGIIPRSKKCPQ
jgi:hypothetical protein